jgi:XRE family aerobic/anaerobic benzoate catabolism transcriptional regulator
MRADHVVDTTGQSEEDSFRALRNAVVDRGG